MTVVTQTETAEVARVAWAPVVRVNLLPPEIYEARAFRRLQRGLLGAVLAALAIAGALVVWAQLGVNHAQQDLDTATSQVDRLTVQKARYSAVPQVIAQVKAAEAARAKVMGNDILWYRYLEQLAASQPTGLQLTAIEADVQSPTTVTSGTGPNTPPLQATGIGSITLGGTAPSYAAVSAWLEALDQLPGIESPMLTSATRATGTGTSALNFTNSAVVGSAALSHRYDETDG